MNTGNVINGALDRRELWEVLEQQVLDDGLESLEDFEADRLLELRKEFGYHYGLGVNP